MKQQDMWMGNSALSLLTSIIQSAIDWVINGQSEVVWADYRQYWEFPIPGIYEDYSNVNLTNLSLMANFMRNIIGESHGSNRETAAEYKNDVWLSATLKGQYLHPFSITEYYYNYVKTFR